MKSLFLAVLCLSGGLLASADEMVPDFKLTDTNPASNRHAGPVSPRDYLLQVSAYYFGHAG
jgi:hypothetical protein